MSDDLELKIKDVLEHQSSTWIKVIFGIIAQTVVVCGFVFAMRSDVNGNAIRLGLHNSRLEQIEANQKDLIRSIVIMEVIQSEIIEMNKKIDDIPKQ